MGYALYIGEAEVVTYMEDRHTHIGVKVIEREDAPLVVANHSNRCHLSYSGLHHFVRRVGLFPVFFAPECPNGSETVWWVPPGEDPSAGQGGLIRYHPGAEALTPGHLAEFKAALDAHEGSSSDRRMLEWLVYWTEWALTNCEYPTFVNH